MKKDTQGIVQLLVFEGQHTLLFSFCQAELFESKNDRGMGIDLRILSNQREFTRLD